ncbi:AsmA-like C-terminal region-containing protein [soil metagenome]
MSTEKAPKKKKSLGRRILKWSGISLLILIVLAILLPVIFKDKIISYAKAEINNKLNATVTMGDFDLSIFSSFPDFRLTMNDLKIVGKESFAKDTLANLPQMKIDLNLMSVISGGPYKINSISLDKPRINARVLANGKANWDIVKADTTAAAATASTEPTKYKLSLKNFSITNGYIVYDDATLGFKTVMDNMNYKLSGDFTQDNFEMKNDLAIDKFTVAYGGMNYLSKVKTKANANLDMDMVNWKFTFKENQFDLNDLGLALDGFFAMPGEDYNMDLKFAAKQNEFKSFLSLIPGAYTTDFANVKAAGKLSFDGFLKGLYSEKQNKMPGYGLNFSITDGSFQYPAVPKAVSAINIDCKIADATGNPDDTKIDLNKFHIDFGGNPIDAGLHVSTPVSDANMDGWVKCKLDLAGIRDLLPLEKDEVLTGKVDADIKMKGRMSQIEKSQYDQFQCSGILGIANLIYKSKDVPYRVNISAMDMSFSPQFVALSKFDGKIGKNDLKADGRIDNLMVYLFKDSLLTGKFNMSSTLMDLNQFMGDETGAAPAPTDTAAMTIMEVPGNIDFTLNSTFGTLIYTDINMSNVSGTVTLKNKVLGMSNIKANLFGGSMVMNGNYSTANAMIPKVDLNMDINDFDIQQTAKYCNSVEKIAPVIKNTNGRFTSHLSYTSNLDEHMMPIINTVNGKGTLSTAKVVVEGFEPLKKLDEALKINKFKKIELQDLKQVSFTIKDGAITTDPFDFAMGKSKGTVGGTTAVDQSINYVMNVAIPRTEFGPANAALTGMLNSATSKGIPVKLGDVVNVQALFGGTVTNPTVKTNLKEAAGNIADELKNAVKDTVTAIVHQVIDDSKGKACVEAQKQLDNAIKAAADTKAAAIKVADAAKTSALAEADKMEKKGGNPLEKAANKKAAEVMRKKANDTYNSSVAAANNTEKNSVAKAQSDKDAKCK